MAGMINLIKSGFRVSKNESTLIQSQSYIVDLLEVVMSKDSGGKEKTKQLTIDKDTIVMNSKMDFPLILQKELHWKLCWCGVNLSNLFFNHHNGPLLVQAFLK